MKKIVLLFVISIIMVGCVTPPKIVGEFITKDLPQACQGLFLDMTYQEKANNSALTYSYFAVGRLDSGKIVTCGSAWGGRLATTELQIKSKALSSCESTRLNFMKQQSVVVNKCEIYAEGNKILSENFKKLSS